jgi:hypothetical protein
MWYKLTADHGPGHQGHTEDYLWSHKMDPEEQKDTWEIWANQFDNAVGTITQVRKLPPKTIKELTERHQQKIKTSQHILQQLKKMQQ